MRRIVNDTCQIKDLEEIYNKYLLNHHTKLFVEVGAFDGETFSNTSGLADNGWRGFYIEPIKEYYELCVDRHKNNNVVVSNVAISDYNGDLEISKAGDISSASKETIEFFESGIIPFFKGKHINSKEKVRCLTLNEYLLNNNIKPNFGLLVIDCEGYEWQVIKEFNLDYYYPRMIIIELHEESAEWLSNESILENTKKCIELLESKGYKKIYKDSINSIFIREYEL